MRRSSILLLALLILVTPVTASAAVTGPRIRGVFSGSGSSTLDVTLGRPILRATSGGPFRAKHLGEGSYSLVVSTLGSLDYVSMTITTRLGSLVVGAGPVEPADLIGAPLRVQSGTGRFATSSGFVALSAYDRTDVVCVPSPPAPVPNVFCNWNESGSMAGRIRVHG
jgi:hypothetical protein